MALSSAAIAVGATVFASDGMLGTVSDVVVSPDGDHIAYLLVHAGWFGHKLMVPGDVIADAPSRDEVRLTINKDALQARNEADSVMGLGRQVGDELHIPLYEERLHAAVRPVDLGEVRLHKVVDTEEETIRLPVMRQDVELERRTVNQFIDSPAVSREENGWFVVPLMEEVLVVQKRLLLREEVRFRRVDKTVEDEIHETKRRERLDVEWPDGGQHISDAHQESTGRQ